LLKGSGECNEEQKRKESVHCLLFLVEYAKCKAFGTISIDLQCSPGGLLTAVVKSGNNYFAIRRNLK
jgi:hypothetical protein